MRFLATEQLAANFGLSSLDMKQLLGWFVQSETTPFRKIVEGLEENMEKRKKENFISIFAIKIPPLLPKVGIEQVCQILRASTAVQAEAF